MRRSLQLTRNTESLEFPLTKYKTPKCSDLLFGFKYFYYSKFKLDVREKNENGYIQSKDKGKKFF